MVVDFRRLQGSGNFYFLRHGKSRGNDALLIQGLQDYSLSAEGRSQSVEAARWFKDKPIDCILTSPLARARQTAEIVAHELELSSPQEHEDLIELNTGIFTGLTLEEIRRKHPEEWKRFQQESWEAVPRAERIDSLYRRAERFWGLLLESFREGKRNILTVTHSGIMQWLIKATLGHRSWMPLFPISNCALAQLRVNNGEPEEEARHYCEWRLVNFRLSGGSSISLLSDGI